MSSGVPQTTINFNNSLEDLIELLESCIVTVMVYYKEMIQITISQEEKHIQQNPEKNNNNWPTVNLDHFQLELRNYVGLKKINAKLYSRAPVFIAN